MNNKSYTSSFVDPHSLSHAFLSRFLPAACHLLLSLVIAVLVGCQPGIITDKQTSEELRPVGGNNARLSLFLNLVDPDGPDIQLEIETFEIFVENNWLPLTIDPQTINSNKIAATQLFLGGRWVEPGRFTSLRFTVAQSSLLQDNGTYKIISADPYAVELQLPTPLVMKKDDSRSLFITWDVKASFESMDNVRPVMTVALPFRQLFVDLVYVACPDIDTIFVIRGDKNWVVDSFGLRGQPTYIALDPDPAQQRLYVLAASESSIKIVELNSQRVIDSFPIPYINDPVFMTLSPDGQWVYVLDENENYLNRLELSTGTLLARTHLGYSPHYATYLSNRNLLAVSSVISQTVTFHDPLDLREVISVQTGDSPDGLLSSDNQLYITESGTNSVSILDIVSKTIESRVAVGFSPRRLLNIDNRIYVSNYDDGSLSIIYPGQLGVGWEILGLGRPLEMVFDRTHRWIYVGDEQKAGLAIIDYSTNQLRGYINLGTRPLGLAIIQ